MSDLLSTLTAQTLGLAPVVQPRVTSRFGPAPLILADAQLALPAPSEPSPWGSPPPGLLSGVDAQAPLFSWRQMQDAAVVEAAVMPVVSEETLDTPGPTDEALTVTPAGPLAPAVPLPAAETTLPRVVEVPTAGPLAASRLLAPVTPGQEQSTTDGDALTQSAPVAPAPALAANPGASTSLPGETIESVPATQPAKVGGQTETILSARPGAPATPAAASFEPHAVPGIVTPAEQTGPVPAAVAGGDQPAATAPGLLPPASNATPDRTGHDDHPASVSLAAQRMVADSDQVAVVNPPLLVFVHGDAPAVVQRKAEASSLAPVGRAHVLAETPSSTTTSDPTMVAPTATQRPVETATTAPAAPDHALEATLTTPVVDEPVPVVPQPAAESDARTPAIPASAVATTADSTTFAVQPGPALAPAARAADSADIARYVSGATPAGESRDTAVVGRPPLSTATGQGPAQAAAVTPLTPARVTAVSLASSGVVAPPGSVPSADPHAGQPVVDATALPEPHPSPAPSARASGSPAAAPVSTVSPRISTTAVLTPAMPSPAPAAVAGATGPVNPMAPEPNVIPPLAEIIARTPVAPTGAPVATSDSAVAAVPRTLEPSVMTPGAPAPVPAAASAPPVIAQHAAPVPAAIPGAAEPAAAGQATAGLTHVQHTAVTAAAAPVAPLFEPITPAGPALAGQPALIPTVVQRTADEAAVMPVVSSPALAVAPGAPVPTHEAAFTPSSQQLAEAAHRAQTVHLQETALTSGGARVIEQSTPAISAIQHPTGPLIISSVVSSDAPAATPGGAAAADQPVVMPAAAHRMAVTPAAQADAPGAAPGDHAASDQMTAAATTGVRASERPALAAEPAPAAAAVSGDTATVPQVLPVLAAAEHTNAASAFAAIASFPASPGGSPREDRPIGFAGEDHGSAVDRVSPVQLSPSAAYDPQSLPAHPEPTIHPAGSPFGFASIDHGAADAPVNTVAQVRPTAAENPTHLPAHVEPAIHQATTAAGNAAGDGRPFGISGIEHSSATAATTNAAQVLPAATAHPQGLPSHSEAAIQPATTMDRIDAAVENRPVEFSSVEHGAAVAATNAVAQVRPTTTENPAHLPAHGEPAIHQATTAAGNAAGDGRPFGISGIERGSATAVTINAAHALPSATENPQSLPAQSEPAIHPPTTAAGNAATDGRPFGISRVERGSAVAPANTVTHALPLVAEKPRGLPAHPEPVIHPATIAAGDTASDSRPLGFSDVDHDSAVAAPNRVAHVLPAAMADPSGLPAQPAPTIQRATIAVGDTASAGRPFGISGIEHSSATAAANNAAHALPIATENPQGLPSHPEPTITTAADAAGHGSSLFGFSSVEHGSAVAAANTLTNMPPLTPNSTTNADAAVTPIPAPDSTTNAGATNLPALAPTPTTNTGATGTAAPISAAHAHAVVTPSLAPDSTINPGAANLPPLTPASTANANAAGTPIPISAANARATVTPSPATIATASARAPHPTPRAHTPESPTIEPTPQPPTPNPQPPSPTPYSLRITIGRIDVRVTAPPPAASTRREPTRPTVSLDDYLSGVGSPP